GHGSAGFEREAHGCRIDGLDAIDPDRGSTLLQGGCDPGDQTASADPDDHDVDLGQILEDLEADAAVAGDHRRILEWVGERETALVADPLQCLQRLADMRALEDDLGTVSATG